MPMIRFLEGALYKYPVGMNLRFLSVELFNFSVEGQQRKGFCLVSLCGGSKHSGWGIASCSGSIHSASLGLFNMFPVSHVYFFDGGGPKSMTKLDEAIAGFSSWICHCMLMLPFLNCRD